MAVRKKQEQPYGIKKSRQRKTAAKVVDVINSLADGDDEKTAFAKAGTSEEHMDVAVLPADCVFTDALRRKGLTEDFMANQFKKLFKSKVSKISNDGKVVTVDDYGLKMRALELWTKVTGNMAPSRSESKSLTINKDITDAELDSLLVLSKEKASVPKTVKTRKGKKTRTI